ncbi:DUF4062 domain-containing protein [Desulfosporosinus sp. SB140]|uniref:DUF4062 domain-containing protein n=1 Tax=Desulfosporosinus paludis TaxID=3115649 RepID=UPI003890AED3
MKNVEKYFTVNSIKGMVAMASPKVFVSSTCYDLKYIRENLRYFIKTIGYEPILSEDGSVFYDPKVHTHDACITEVPNAQMFVLVIGGRFGGQFKSTEYSITNAEYREACKQKIPIFALVEQSVYNEHHVYLRNKSNPDIDESKIIYPSVDNIKIFSFIDEVRKSAVNNAIVPFTDFSDIEQYLRQQWAGMMFSFLTRDNEEKRILDTLSMLGKMNDRVEMLSEQILSSVGTKEAIVTVKLYEEMLSENVIQDLMYWSIKPTPISILVNETFGDCVKFFGKDYWSVKKENFAISSSGEIEENRLERNIQEYTKLRQRLVKIIQENGLNEQNYVQIQQKTGLEQNRLSKQIIA